jgi:hypothetical protein
MNFNSLRAFRSELTESGGIETESDDPFEFKPEYQRQSTEAKPVKTLDKLYKAAKIAEPISSSRRWHK